MVAAASLPLACEAYKILLQPIQRCKLDLLDRVDSGDGIRRISKFFGELEESVSVLDTKYSHRGGRFSTVQRLVPARCMVARSLQKIHAKIIRRLNTRPRLANPSGGDFQMDMPQEVFDCISKDLMQRTSFGQRFRETSTQVVYEITDMRKAKYLFTRMDLDGIALRGVRCWCRMKSQWSSNLISQRSCFNLNFITDTGIQVASRSTEQS